MLLHLSYLLLLLFHFVTMFNYLLFSLLYKFFLISFAFIIHPNFFWFYNPFYNLIVLSLLIIIWFRIYFIQLLYIHISSSYFIIYYLSLAFTFIAQFIIIYAVIKGDMIIICLGTSVNNDTFAESV